MHRLPTLGLAVAAVLFVADQLTKYWVTGVLGLNVMTAETTLTPFFDLRFVANHGVSLGLLRADGDLQRWALVAMTGAIAAGVLVWMHRERARADQIGLGLVLGGALGNILDRVRFGYVVDFADLHFGEWRPFLIFNVADAAITIGVVILIVRALLSREKPGP
ncbi:signal peptidase II, partial [Escherichia coli]|uniref:signal peptidase II n=1 Tax=Escherichia coli TaxID=562 RepID=UPI00214B44BA